MVFQSTLSVRRATEWQDERYTVVQFQSTLSVRRATLNLAAHSFAKPISIHALRKESDYFDGKQTIDIPISIHALRKESDGWIGCCSKS